MSTLVERLDAVLRDGITGNARRVMVGLNWTYVEGPIGAGLVHSPARGTEGCRSLPEPGNYQGRGLAYLSMLTASDNIFERVLGYAAINAHHNRFDLNGETLNGLDMTEARGSRTVVVGRFPGLEAKLPGATIIEREPATGDYPPEAASQILPNAEFIAITASTVSNGTLGELLNHAPESAFTVLVGPSAPLCPALFDLGIDALSGMVPCDLDGTARRIAEGGSVNTFKQLGRYVTLRRQAALPR